jgi:hypothetical protein
MEKRRLICLISSFVLTFLIPLPLTFAAPWYQEDFDELPNGDLIGKGGWTGFHGFLVVQDKVAHGETGKSIKTVPDGEAQYISFYVSKRGFNPYVAFYAGDSPDGKWNQQGIAAHLEFGNGGLIQVGDGGVMKDIGINYVKEQWHHVRIVIDFDNEDWQIYFDDKLAADRLAFESTPKELNWMRIIAGDTHPLAFFDDFKIGNVGEEFVTPKNRLITTWSSVKLSNNER